MGCSSVIPDNIEPSAAVLLLESDFSKRYVSNGMRLYYREDLASKRDECIYRAYETTADEKPVIRRAKVLDEFCRSCDLPLQQNDMLAGTLAYNRPWFNNGSPHPNYASTTGHIVHDYQSLVQLGISGLKDIVNSATAHDPTQEYNRRAYTTALNSLHNYILRYHDNLPAGSFLSDHHADDLLHIAYNPPQTFYQALQLMWFAHILLHIENPSVAISFGRFDQYLYPFLQNDLQNQRITVQEAFDLLCAFLLKCCEGEESQNMVIGGSNEENLLSFLVLRAMKCMRTIQPSISVRIGTDSSNDFMKACCELAAEGTGNPGFMNERVVARSLAYTGIEEKDISDWSIVGCYEATISGKCYPNTVLGRLNLPRELSDFILGMQFLPADFDSFVTNWKTHIQSSYCRHINEITDIWMHFRQDAPSPLGSVLMHGCRDNLVPLECGGAPYNLIGINILGIGSLVDGLLAIKHSVYNKRLLTIEELTESLKNGNADDLSRLTIRNHPLRYGKCDNVSVDLTEDISSFLADMVLGRSFTVEKDEYGPEVSVQPYPAFFGFSADIYDTDFASPDGRQPGDLISYGVSPALSSFDSATAALCAASRVAQDKAACGSPFSLNLPENMAEPNLIEQLVKSYFDLGGFHLHINIADAQLLRDAMKNPEEHQDLMIRVSGFSAKFVTLDKKWQEALIERAEKGH